MEAGFFIGFLKRDALCQTGRATLFLSRPGPINCNDIMALTSNKISAGAAESHMSRYLELAKGAACLQVERETWRDGAAVTLVRQVFDDANYARVAGLSTLNALVTTVVRRQ